MPRHAKLKYVAEYIPRNNYVHVDEIAPSDFLKIALRGWKVEEHKKAYIESGRDEWGYVGWQRLMERMKGGQKLDSPELWVKTDCRCWGHEGRHRAVTAKRLGIKKLPVRVYCVDNHGRERPVRDCERCLARFPTKIKPEEN